MAIGPIQVDGTARLLRPGVYFRYARPERVATFQTGRPVFIGLPQVDAAASSVQVHSLSKWEDFHVQVGKPSEESYLAPAVRGFFENGGERCVVVTCTFEMWPKLIDDDVHARPSRLWEMDDVDLVCAPDLPRDPAERMQRQQQILAYCERMGNLFAILDAPLEREKGVEVDVDYLLAHRTELVSPNGAIYFPWIQTRHSRGRSEWVPPCGHIAGVYARTDARVGVHKAPANETVEGIVDLRVHVSDTDHGNLNGSRVNCLRVVPGRGIRVLGARTLIDQHEWRYVNVRRLFIAVRRRLETEYRDLVFDSNSPQLWNRIRDRLNNYCYTLYRSGALKGETPEEAYFVKCDAETNPPEHRDNGLVTTDVGLAATRPAEFIVVRITQQVASGSPDATVTIT
jgi:uncharacterized protein